MTTSVLAIDDSATIRALVTQTLTEAGFVVTTAVDGADGVNVFQSRRFDAVLTDINMPTLDGFGVIEAIRNGTSNKRVPILVLTTESGQGLKTRAQAAGATGWIVKPFEDHVLVDVLRRVTGGA